MASHADDCACDCCTLALLPEPPVSAEQLTYERVPMDRLLRKDDNDG